MVFHRYVLLNNIISVQVSLTWLLLTIMEAEIIEELQSSRSSIVRDSSEINDNLQYTSLKDIICNTPTRYSTLFYEGNEAFDSNIAIRNELVKRAASVYLQSAALLATRNQNYFVDFWERLKIRAASCSCWIKACLWPVFHFLNHVLGTFRSLPTFADGL